MSNVAPWKSDLSVRPREEILEFSEALEVRCSLVVVGPAQGGLRKRSGVLIGFLISRSPVEASIAGGDLGRDLLDVRELQARAFAGR